MTGIAAQLRAAGMSQKDAQAKATLFTRCGSALTEMTGVAAKRVSFFVPGRIEVLGKHTDYAGGRSLLCAAQRGFAVLAAPRADGLVRIIDAVSSDARELTMDAALDTDRGDWSTYVATVLRRLARDFPLSRKGVDIAFASDLPAASGLSSSSALVVATYLAVNAANDIESQPAYQAAIDSRESLAGYLGAVESGLPFGALEGDRGVGVSGGSQDHTAILCCTAGMISRYSFGPVRHEAETAWPADHVIAVAHSGIAAEKTTQARERYNEASSATRCVLAAWNKATGRTDATLADAVASAPTAVDGIRAILALPGADAAAAQRLRDRFEQFNTESNVIVPAAEAALARRDLEGFGEVVDRSQAGAEKLLGNQVPETIALQRLARENGAPAASAFGAGFGGSVWAMISTADCEDFINAWRAAYTGAFPDAAADARFFVTCPGPPAMRL